MTMRKIKFAHIADPHLGAWRKDSMNEYGYEAFLRAIDIAIKEKVAFVLLTGDLFDISNPKVDVVDTAAKGLTRLAKSGIPVYGIMGSHDFSPTDKSMVRPLKTAELFTDVSRGKMEDDGKLQLLFTVDPKTNIKLTGIRARKQALEIEDYQILDRKLLEKETGFKIFLLHTMLSELKPPEYADMESAPKSLLPGGFQYYAGGHLHKTVPELLRDDDHQLAIDEKSRVIYPGMLFPTNFRELGQYHHGGFCIVEGEYDPESGTSALTTRWIPIVVKEILPLRFDVIGKSAEQALSLVLDKVTSTPVQDKIVTINVSGMLEKGKVHEVRPEVIVARYMQAGASEVFVNKYFLQSKETASVNVVVGQTPEQIEAKLITEYAQKAHVRKFKAPEFAAKIHELLNLMGRERDPEKKVGEFDAEVLENFKRVFGIEEEEDA